MVSGCFNWTLCVPIFNFVFQFSLKMFVIIIKTVKNEPEQRWNFIHFDCNFYRPIVNMFLVPKTSFEDALRFNAKQNGSFQTKNKKQKSDLIPFFPPSQQLLTHHFEVFHLMGMEWTRSNFLSDNLVLSFKTFFYLNIFAAAFVKLYFVIN